jgi:hypothetical protein
MVTLQEVMYLCSAIRLSLIAKVSIYLRALSRGTYIDFVANNQTKHPRQIEIVPVTITGTSYRYSKCHIL